MKKKTEKERQRKSFKWKINFPASSFHSRRSLELVLCEYESNQIFWSWRKIIILFFYTCGILLYNFNELPTRNLPPDGLLGLPSINGNSENCITWVDFTEITIQWISFFFPFEKYVFVVMFQVIIDIKESSIDLDSLFVGLYTMHAFIILLEFS